MKLKKLVTLEMAGIISASFLTGCGGSTESANNGDEKYTIAMVTDVAGVNDQSFNQSAWEGLQRAEKELGVEVKYLESKQDADYTTNIETLVDEEVDLILGVGAKLAPTIEEAAKNYPEQKFLMVDETYEEIPSNVTPIVFRANEAAYLTGLIAGKMTKTNEVGFIGGMDNPVVNQFEYGYKAGVVAANDKANVKAQYAGTFGDAAKGKSIANQMYANNIDTILSAAGGTGIGAIESAKEQNKYAIGVDRDQSDLAPENILTSALKKVNVGVYETVKAFVEGEEIGGKERVYGLKEDGVGIPESTKNLVPQDIIDYVNEMAEKVKNGEIKVPATKDEYEAMNK